jgi:hypothetical protein
MPDKYDCFGIAHRDTCKRPSWATISGRIGQATVQRCMNRPGFSAATLRVRALG